MLRSSVLLAALVGGVFTATDLQAQSWSPFFDEHNDPRSVPREAVYPVSQNSWWPTFPRARKAAGYALYPVEWATRPARRVAGWTFDRMAFWRPRPQGLPSHGMRPDPGWNRYRRDNPSANPTSEWFSGSKSGLGGDPTSGGWLSQGRPGF